MTSNPNSPDFNYKNYSLEKLQEWVHDALSCGEASPHEIYSAIREAVREDYYYYKDHCSRAYGLLELLSGNRPVKNNIKSCDKDDPSPECKKSWVDFWEETYYPEEVKDDGMRPWGHSDIEYGLANSLLTEDRISNFPGEQYTEEELNAMCDKAASDQEKDKCREYNLREAEYYNKRAKLDAEYNAIKAAGGYEWTPEPPEKKSENYHYNDGRNRTYQEMLDDGWTMTDDGFWIREK